MNNNLFLQTVTSHFQLSSSTSRCTLSKPLTESRVILSKYLKCAHLLNPSIYTQEPVSIPSFALRNREADNSATIGCSRNRLSSDRRFGQYHNHSRSTEFRNFSSRRSICLTSTSMFTPKEAELLAEKYPSRECRFLNSYGHTVGLEWGRTDAPNKVLCVHGWLDNAGSFEALVPHILDHGNNSEKYHIIAMDMPGVGHSSHLPSGAIYSQFIVLAEMRRIVQQLKWKSLTLIGHSMGAHLCYLYSCLYPDQVERMVAIDLSSPITRPIHNSHLSLANSIEDHLKYEYEHEDDPTTNINTTVYSEADALKRLMDAHSNALTKESAMTLMKRGARTYGVGYTFCRDLRWRFASPEMRFDDDSMLEFMSVPFRTSLLVIMADGTPYKRPKELTKRYFDFYQSNCRLFKHIEMKGTHHLHMNTPKPVALEINKFLHAESPRDESITKSNL